MSSSTWQRTSIQCYLYIQQDFLKLFPCKASSTNTLVQCLSVPLKSPLPHQGALLRLNCHLKKLNSLALLSFLWLPVTHQKRSQPECPPPLISQGSPSSSAPLVFLCNCSLAYVWLSSVNRLPASSSCLLEFHLCNSQPAPLKTHIAVPFNSSTWSTVSSPAMMSSA